jgi:hypothetical protein
MGKSYRRHHKRPKRKNTRRRRGAGAGDARSWSSMLPSSSSMKEHLQKQKEHLQKQYQKGLEEGQKHIESAQEMAKKLHKQGTELHKQASDTATQKYNEFKYGSPQGFAIANSGEYAAKTMKPHYDKVKSAAKAMKPHYDKVKSSVALMGSSMGFSPLSKNETDIEALKHAQKQGPIGTPMQNDPYNLRQPLSL